MPEFPEVPDFLDPAVVEVQEAIARLLAKRESDAVAAAAAALRDALELLRAEDDATFPLAPFEATLAGLKRLGELASLQARRESGEKGSFVRGDDARQRGSDRLRHGHKGIRLGAWPLEDSDE